MPFLLGHCGYFAWEKAKRELSWRDILSSPLIFQFSAIFLQKHCCMLLVAVCFYVCSSVLPVVLLVV